MPKSHNVPQPNYRWQCHRCRTINEPDVDRCGACVFAAIATGYEILGQEDSLPTSMSESQALLMERIARVIHLVAGVGFSWGLPDGRCLSLPRSIPGCFGPAC